MLPIRTAIYQQAADEVGGNLLGGAGEEGLRECWEGLGGYGSGLVDGWVRSLSGWAQLLSFCETPTDCCCLRANHFNT